MRMHDRDNDELTTDPDYEIGDIVEWWGYTVRSGDSDSSQKLLIISVEMDGNRSMPSYKCLDLLKSEYIHYTCWYINKNYRKIA